MRAAIAAERHDLAAVLRHRVRLCAHRLLIRSSDGWERAVALEPKSVAQFYAEVMAALRELTLEVSIRTTGTEAEHAIPFQDDHEHASYDPDHVRRFWQQLVPAAGIFKLPSASITNATSSFERLAIRLTMLGWPSMPTRRRSSSSSSCCACWAPVTPHGPRLSAASRSVRLAGTAHGGVALQIPSGRWASSQPACTNR